ncbi:MAG: hypothetical protein K8R73_00975, partial [Clostridiales bacterium]|nr:hypothetical protein [Clostridiales bacterium]
MRNKLLSIFLATLMIFGGSFSAFAVPVILDYIGPINVSGPQSVEVVMPKINAFMVDEGYDPFLWMEKIEAWGNSDDYVYFTPPEGGRTTYTLHYVNPIPDVIWNEDTMSYDIVPSDPPRDLEYFIIKSGTNAYVMILPEPLALGETLEVTLPADISHFYVAAYESPTEIYSIISGYKYNAEGIELPISGVSFDFEIYDSEDNLVVTAYSDPNTGEMYFTMLDELGDPIPGMIDLLNLELPEGVYTIYELDETGYEFVRYELRDLLGGLISEGDTDPFFEFTSASDIDFIFYFYNQMKTSEITGIKVDGEGEPIPGVSFDFEIYNELDELIATAQSDSTSGVLSFIPVGEVDPVNPLILPYGMYSIKEITATEYDYLGYELWLDGIFDSSGVTEEIDFMVGDVDTIHFVFSNEIKTSDITGIKVDPDGNPILDMNFDFEIYNDLDELIATAESHETTGELWFLPVGELTPVT